MEQKLKGVRVAILSADGFEKSELLEPRKALEEAGADIQVISLKTGSIKSWNKNDWGESIGVDGIVAEANPADFDALLLPGGVMNPDKLREDEKALEFVRAFAEAGKPIAAICHGPQTLISAGLVEGRRMTSYPAIKADLINAGADWVDEEVVVDDGWVTSRKPSDIPAFNKKMIEEFAEGLHSPQRQYSGTSYESTPRH